MSNVFDRFRNNDGSANIINIMMQFKQIQQNPAQIGNLLYKAGRINESQLSDIEKMKSPREIGEYLMNHNADFSKMIGRMKQ